MTLQDLYKSVSQLGFEDSLGEDGNSRFIYATNRAMLQVSALRPAKRRIVLNHKVPENLLGETGVIETDQPLVYRLPKGKAFYVEVSGEGEVTVGIEYKEKVGDAWVENLESGTSAQTFKTEAFETKRGFIKSISGQYIDSLTDTETKKYLGIRLTITPSGATISVRNAAIYGTIYSTDVNKITSYGEMTSYNLNAIVSDFERFDTPPIFLSAKNMEIEYDADDNGKLYLPRQKTGEYTVSYIHKVRLIENLDNIETETIDLADDLAALLPNLIAAYVWLDDEAEKAQFYYNLYLQQSAEIERRKTDASPMTMMSVYGW
jgi:hypothetical protein